MSLLRDTDVFIRGPTVPGKANALVIGPNSKILHTHPMNPNRVKPTEHAETRLTMFIPCTNLHNLSDHARGYWLGIETKGALAVTKGDKPSKGPASKKEAVSLSTLGIFLSARYDKGEVALYYLGVTLFGAVLFDFMLGQSNELLTHESITCACDSCTVGRIVRLRLDDRSVDGWTGKHEL